MSLPLGTKPTILTVNLPKRIETDSLKTVTFAYRNASGMPISSRLKYRIDKGEWTPAFHTDKGVVIDLRAAMCAKHTSPSSPAASRCIFR